MSPTLDFCAVLGLSVPVVQAPIGSASTPELAAAVSNAGGLGMLALTWTDGAEVTARIRRTQALTSKPFGVNLVLAWPQHERLARCLDEGWQWFRRVGATRRLTWNWCREAGALHVHTVGSAAEARQVVAAGVDVVVAQGWEAGGHVWGEVATLPLVPMVVDAVHPTPVLAAGGIADGRGLAAVLALGAAAGWVGTRYLLAVEANVHPDYQASVAAATEADTVYGVVFDGGWPNAAHRALRNSTRPGLGGRRATPAGRPTRRG